MRHAVRAHCQTNRTLGGDVHCRGAHIAEALAHRSLHAESQPDFRIAGTGDGVESFRRQHADFMAATRQLLDGLFKRADDTVGLRPPGIRGNEYSHRESLWMSTVTWP